MTVRECYESMGADYSDVISRLVREESIKKFAIKFLNDTSYKELCVAMEGQNYGAAFEAAHTLKGVSQNLGFTNLYEASHVMTEKLRAGQNEEAGELMAQVGESYQQTISAIQKLQAES